MYGRGETEWDQLIECGYKFLLERARNGRYTSYTELSTVLRQRTGHRGFDFSYAEERAAMGHLLGEIVKRDRIDYPDQMISALVFYLNVNDAGTGFYQLAQDLGLLTLKPSKEAKERFWTSQVRAVHSRFSRTSREPE